MTPVLPGRVYPTAAVYVVSTTGVGGFHPTQLTSLRISPAASGLSTLGGVGPNGDIPALAGDGAEGKVSESRSRQTRPTTPCGGSTQRREPDGDQGHFAAGATLNFAEQVNDGGSRGSVIDAQEDKLYYPRPTTAATPSQNDLGSLYYCQWNKRHQHRRMVKHTPIHYDVRAQSTAT